MTMITRECGHQEYAKILGSNSRQKQSRENYESGKLCYECWKAEEAKKAAEKAKEIGLPELEGTEKQVAYATTLRAKTIKDYKIDAAKILKQVEFAESKLPADYKYRVEFAEIKSKITAIVSSKNAGRVIEACKEGFVGMIETTTIQGLNATKIEVVAEAPKAEEDSSEKAEEAEPLASEPTISRQAKIMRRAWQIATEAAAKFGGRKNEYIAAAMRQAWKETK